MDTFLKTLKVDSMGDIPFKSGMKAVAKDILQDPVANGQPKYEPTFMSPDKLHGVILVASNTRQGVDNKLAAIKKVLGSTVKEVDTIEGKVRPKPNKGHEQYIFHVVPQLPINTDLVSASATKTASPSPASKEWRKSVAQGEARSALASRSVAETEMACRIGPSG